LSSLQDLFLNQVRKEGKLLCVYLVNGVHFEGRIAGFDNFVIILDTDSKQELIYKHAISTLMPVDRFRIKQEVSKEQKPIQREEGAVENNNKGGDCSKPSSVS